MGPNRVTRFAELKRRYDYATAVSAVCNPVSPGEAAAFKLDTPWLPAAVADIEKEYGLFGFVSSEGRDQDPDYANISLTYNQNIPGDPHVSTLGSASVSKAGHFYGAASLATRDSYYDTYGFNTPTPAAVKHLGPLFARMKRSPVRARLSVIRSGHAAPASFFWGWHKDEPVFENLRVNIHVADYPDHRIQIMREDQMPTGPDDPRIVEHVFKPGFGYSWDTNLPHRACSTNPTAPDRAAIVLGFSPWFDYDAAADEWAPNEFFGKKHPLQMLLDGDVL